MKIELLSNTPDALNLLLRTKDTRLKADDDPATWPEEKKQEHLAYMRDTIKSSWEFVDYTFRINGVTRAFTHQLVRTRTGSYAQEAQRVIDAREHKVVMPMSLTQREQNAELTKLLAPLSAQGIWDHAVGEMMDGYAQLMDMGVAAQDARGLLPTNITTSIIAKFNLRTLHEMAKLRLCTRTQGEYQNVFRAMRGLVIGVHPWAAEFIEVYCAAHGSCAFPRYGEKECPVWFPALYNDHVRAEAKSRFWSMRHEAAPVAKNGKAM